MSSEEPSYVRKDAKFHCEVRKGHKSGAPPNRKSVRMRKWLHNTNLEPEYVDVCVEPTPDQRSNMDLVQISVNVVEKLTSTRAGWWIIIFYNTFTCSC